MIIFITAQPEHPTKQQIIQTLDNTYIPYEVVHPTISWWKLKKKLLNYPDPLSLISPDHPRIFNLCKHLTKTKYKVINSPEITLLCRNRISISLRIKELLDKYIQSNRNALIHIPDPRYFRNPVQMGNSLNYADYPIVIKYPVNHTGIHYVNMINSNDFQAIPRFFTKCGLYVEKFIEAQDNILKCYNLGNYVITQQESNRQSLYRALNSTPETYKARKDRKTIETPLELENFSAFIEKELKISIFGMDFLITEENHYWIVDFNDFPGARGIDNAGEIIANFLIRKIR